MLLKMSLSGGILIILIIIMRHLLTNRLPKKVFVLLWDIVLLRLLIPFDLPFKYGLLLPLYNNITKEITVKSPVNTGRPVNLSIQAENYNVSPAASKVSNVYGINLPVLIWITGTVILFIIFALLYLKEYRIIREALPVTKEQEDILRQAVEIPERIKLLTSDRIFTPLASGIIHPGIILPKLFKPDNLLSLKYIITHEIIHIKRADNLWKILVLSAACIHWFNPLAWIMYILFNRDLEISCDEKVLSVFGNNAKKDYAMALADFAENQSNWHFSNGFGKKPIQERIEAIMKYKKLTVPGAICAMVLLGTAVTVFAKGTVPEDNNQAVTEEQKNISKMEKLLNKEGSSATPSAIYNCYEGKDNDLSYFACTEEFKEYEKFGLSYNDKTGHLMYNGKIVGYFHDETSKNVFTHITDEAGTIGIKVQRNSSNKITGFKKVKVPYIFEPDEAGTNNLIISYALNDSSYTVSEDDDVINPEIKEEDFTYTISENDGQNNAVISESNVAYASSEDDGDNSTLLEDYKKYGLTYKKSLDTWQYNGKNIAGFWDEGKMLYTSGDVLKDGVYLIINDGAVKEVSKKEFSKAFNN